MTCSLYTPASMAGSQLMVTPTRVVFDAKSRTAQVSVINNGDETGTYRIELVNKRMTENGKFENVKQARSGENFADKMIRYSPRQVVLEPGKAQVVRFMLRRPANLAPGEYRSHILFKAIPKQAGKDIKSVTKSEGISISLTPIISVSIPAIVRHGKTEASISFANMKYQAPSEKQPKPSIYMEMQRKGNQSVYGDLLVEHVQDNGTSNVLAQINGIAVYTPNKLRRLTLPLKIPEGVDVKSGVLRVFYRDNSNKRDKIIAQIQFKAN